MEAIRIWIALTFALPDTAHAVMTYYQSTIRVRVASGCCKATCEVEAALSGRKGVAPCQDGAFLRVWGSLVAYLVWIQDVEGSNPSTLTWSESAGLRSGGDMPPL